MAIAAYPYVAISSSSGLSRSGSGVGPVGDDTGYGAQYGGGGRRSGPDAAVDRLTAIGYGAFGAAQVWWLNRARRDPVMSRANCWALTRISSS